MMSLFAAALRWFTAPPQPSFLTHRNRTGDDAAAIIHATTQYLLDIHPALHHSSYNRSLHDELLALSDATYTAVAIYGSRSAKGAR